MALNMNRKIHQLLSSIALGAVLGLSACSKQAEAPNPEPSKAKVEVAKPVTVEVVKETERSRSFLAVSKHLELGGTVYGYMDVDGDVLKLVGSLRTLVGQFAAVQPEIAPYLNQDYAALAGTLGLTDIKAVGVSSVPEGNLVFRNKAFFYTGGERHGLLAGLGGQPGPFKHLNLAPADAGLFLESEMDAAVIYKTVKEVVTKVAGEPVGNQMEGAIKKAGEEIALSLIDLIYGLKGRSALVLRIDPAKPLRLPGPPPAMAVPGVSLLLCVEGVAPVIEASLAQMPMLRRTDAGGLHVYELAQPLPIEGIRPVLIADGSTLFFASTREFFDECRAGKNPLAQDPQFKQALARVGNEGNGLTYVSPRLFEQLREIPKLNPSLPPQMQQMMEMGLAQLPAPRQPLVAIRTNLPDGVLVRSYWNRSLKQDLAAGVMYNPVTVGLLAAMAIPAFQKVRTASQEKAILNNLRMLAAAADQYYLETGKTTAGFDDLVGPTKYVKSVESVMGEDYRRIRFALDLPLRVTLPGGRVMQYPMPEMTSPAPLSAPRPGVNR